MRRTRAGRRKFAFGFSVMALFLAMASVAYACTIFKGTMTVTDPSNRVSSAVGSGGGMTYCHGVTPGAQASSSGGTSVTVEISAGSGGCNGNLPDGDYDVNFIANTAYDYMFSQWILDQANGNCMSGSPGSPGTTTLAAGGLTVTSGAGSLSVTIPSSTADATNDRSGVCVSDPNGGTGPGNEVPIQIVV